MPPILSILKLSSLIATLITAAFLIWKVCSWYSDAQYKDKYNVLITSINQAQNQKKQVSDKYYAVLTKRQEQSSKSQTEVLNEINKNGSSNNCKYVVNSVWINDNVRRANNFRSS